MNSINPRRIAPAPPPSSGDQDVLHRTATASNVNKSGIRRASTACQSCKHIKRKCDQRSPCSNCIKTGVECAYDQTQDGRRRAARKRNVEDLELKRDALETILDALRCSPDHDVQHLIHLVRTHAPLEEILQHATESQRETSTDQYSTPASSDGTHLTKKSMLSIDDLCDSPIITVPAAPWTSITTDDDFVSHLISIYFTWYHPSYACVDKDLFVRDMAAGNLDCSFCSPLLVHAMLAIACYFTDHPKVCKEPGDCSTRGQHFTSEALRLWNEELGRPKLLNLQAGQPLAVALTLTGKDRLSLHFIDQMDKMAQDLVFKFKRGTQNHGVEKESKRSLSLALWSLHLLAVGCCLAFMKPVPSTWCSPTIDRPFDAQDVKTISEWVPYPNREPTFKISYAIIHDAHCDLHMLGAEVTRFVFNKDKHNEDDRKSIARSLEQKLANWEHNLLWKTRSEKVNELNPITMDLHLAYHWIRITLFNFLRISPPSSASKADEISFERYAREQCLASAKTAANLCNRFSREFGSRALTIWMPQTAVSIAYMLIDDLSDPEGQEIFYNVCLVLSLAAKKWLVMRGHIRMIFITAEEKGQVIPERTQKLLRPTALDAWAADDHKRFDTASYPNYALAKEDDPRTATMAELLERWATLSLQ